MENGERPGAAAAVLRTNFGRSVSQAVERGALASRGLPHEADEGITAHCVVESGKGTEGGRGNIENGKPSEYFVSEYLLGRGQDLPATAGIVAGLYKHTSHMEG